VVSLLAKKFIKENMPPEKIRRTYGLICGAAGIFFNFLLFSAKLLAGYASGSIAIIADAFNNLSDAATSAGTLFSFVLSSRMADREHPFGHGRVEYITGIFVSVAIILVGIELFKSSFKKILTPSDVFLNKYIVIVLVLSILVKLYMAYYNGRYAKRINSPTLNAVKTDSLSDCATTLVVLLSSVFAHFTGIRIDGFVGVIMALFITRMGIKSVLDTASPLLGTPPPQSFVDEIERIVSSNPETIGFHDLVVHNYGPDKIFVSLHMEVDGSRDMLYLHDAADLVEREISEKLGCEVIIHMDPLDVKNPVLKEVFNRVCDAAHKINPSISIHDMRMVTLPTHTNIIFEAMLPPEIYSRSDEIEELLSNTCREVDESFFAIIRTETSYC